jgi:hypothetical protein
MKNKLKKHFIRVLLLIALSVGLFKQFKSAILSIDEMTATHEDPSAFCYRSRGVTVPGPASIHG